MYFFPGIAEECAAYSGLIQAKNVSKNNAPCLMQYLFECMTHCG